MPPALQEVIITARNLHVVLIGLAGSGKSYLFNLILPDYDSDSMKWDDNHTCTSDSATYHMISGILDNSNKYRDVLRAVFQPGLDYHVSFVIGVMDGRTHVARTANINVINMALYLLYPNRIKYNIIFNNIPEAFFMTFNPNDLVDNLLYPPVFTALVKSNEKIYARLDLIRFINMPKLRTEDLFLRPDIPIRTTNRYLVLIDEVLGKG